MMSMCGGGLAFSRLPLCLSCRSFASRLIRFCPLLAPDFFNSGRHAISSHLAFLRSCRSASPPAVFAVLSRLRFELVKTARFLR